jgi:hypothetical protein
LHEAAVALRDLQRQLGVAKDDLIRILGERNDALVALREALVQLGEANRDAERYRWLRVSGFAIDLDSIWLTSKTVKDVDINIDAARSAT